MWYMKRFLLLVFVALCIISYIIMILNITFLVFNLNPINMILGSLLIFPFKFLIDGWEGWSIKSNSLKILLILNSINKIFKTRKIYTIQTHKDNPHINDVEDCIYIASSLQALKCLYMCHNIKIMMRQVFI